VVNVTLTINVERDTGNRW